VADEFPPLPDGTVVSADPAVNASAVAPASSDPAGAADVSEAPWVVCTTIVVVEGSVPRPDEVSTGAATTIAEPDPIPSGSTPTCAMHTVAEPSVASPLDTTTIASFASILYSAEVMNPPFGSSTVNEVSAGQATD
jgi:hypothetical protein